MVAHDMFPTPIMNLSVIEGGVMILQLYWPTQTVLKIQFTPRNTNMYGKRSFINPRVLDGVKGVKRRVGGEGKVAHDMFPSPIMNLSVIEGGVMILQLYWTTLTVLKIWFSPRNTIIYGRRIFINPRIFDKNR